MKHRCLSMIWINGEKIFGIQEHQGQSIYGIVLEVVVKNLQKRLKH